MSFSRHEYDTIRKYLLGQLTREDHEEFEHRFFIDDGLFKELQAAEDDLIDDFLTGDLSEDDVVMFHQNFLVGAEREQKLLVIKAWRKYAAAHAGEKPPKTIEPALASRWQQLFSTPPLRIAALAALVLLAVVGVWRILFFESDIEKGLQALNAAYPQRRPLESRITELKYAPFVTTRGLGANNVNDDELRRAELILLDAVSKKPTPEARHALGRVYLAKKEFEKAIEQYEEALKGDPNNAQVFADLGAALLEKGKIEIASSKTDKANSSKGVEDLSRSLDNLNKALDRDPNLLEALFNRAFVNRYLALLPQAQEDWRKYLEKDPNSKWADEALQNLRLVEEERKKTSQTREEILDEFLSHHKSGDEEATWRIVSNNQNRTGNVVAEHLLDAYLEHVGSHQRDEADHNLALLSYVGELEKRRSGDRFFLDLASFYRSITPQQHALLVRARELMKEGHAGWGQLSVKKSLDLFGKAKQLFDQAGDVAESHLVDYWISFCYSRQHSEEESQKILVSLVVASETNGYRWLQVRCLYLLSTVHFALNAHSRAVYFAQLAINLAHQSNDPVGMLNAVSALIEYYRYLGNYQKSLAYIQSALPLLSAISLDPVQGARHYGFAAVAFAAVGLNAAAAGYQREALRLALNTGVSAAKSYNYAFLGLINGKLGNFSDALENVGLAFDSAHSHPNDAAGHSLIAYSLLQLANIYRLMGDFNKAVSNYNQSIEIYETLNFSTHLYQAHKGRLLCYISLKNDSLAGEEISKTLNLIEKYREQIREENNRNSFFDVEQSVYDVAIDFEVSRMNNFHLGFEYLQSSRARSLLDLLKRDAEKLFRAQEPDIVLNSVSQPLTLSAIKDQMPSGSEIVQYAVLDDKLVVWVISNSSIAIRQKEIAQKDLNEKILRYLKIISKPSEHDEEERFRLAKDLYTVLIQPVESLLDKNKQISIIPDKTLSYLPFGSLVSPASGKYLIEDYVLMTSLSPSVFLFCSAAAAQKGEAKPERLLSVGNPQFDRTAYPDLDDLPSASKEALEVADCYDSKLPLIEDMAKREAVRSEMGRSEVVHLALHTALDDEVPLRSRLLLTKAGSEKSEDSSESALYAYEIYNLKLPRTRLVVLSSCQSGAERYYGGEGMTSLARAFIGAGVPLVVASLWPVDSAATRELMVGLHKHRMQDNLSTAEALASAQRHMLRSPVERFRHPYYWAAFTLTGGYATF